MDIKSSVTVAVVTYNECLPYKRGIVTVEGRNVLFLPKSFNPKGPESVVPGDSNWLLLMKYKKSLKRVIIFAGKETSGALTIIDLACVSFRDKKECLFFVLCDHEQEKKERLLEKYGITREQYICFEDGYLPCREAPLLKGYMLEYVQLYSS